MENVLGQINSYVKKSTADNMSPRQGVSSLISIIFGPFTVKGHIFLTLDLSTGLFSLLNKWFIFIDRSNGIITE